MTEKPAETVEPAAEIAEPVAPAPAEPATKAAEPEPAAPAEAAPEADEPKPAIAPEPEPAIDDRARFADRTTATVERGPRHPDDRRTQTERINGTGPGRFGRAEDEPAAEIDWDAPRAPYRTTEWSIFGGVRLPPGSVVHLQPHEVGPHHVEHSITGETE